MTKNRESSLLNIKSYASVLKSNSFSFNERQMPIAYESKKYCSVRKSAELPQENFPRSRHKCNQIDHLLDMVCNLLSSCEHSCSEGKTTNDLQIYYFEIFLVIFMYLSRFRHYLGGGRGGRRVFPK